MLGNAKEPATGVRTRVPVDSPCLETASDVVFFGRPNLKRSEA